jgi:hypothetical protein
MTSANLGHLRRRMPLRSIENWRDDLRIEVGLVVPGASSSRENEAGDCSDNNMRLDQYSFLIFGPIT